MIAFGSPITQPESYDRYAKPGIRLAAEPDSEVYANQAAATIFRSYNIILDGVAARDDLEALVLLHQDVEIVDPDFCAKLRRALSDPQVGVVGCVGAIGVRSLAWWEGSVTWASFTHCYQELGGGEIPAFSMNDRIVPPPAYARTGEVDTVDGFLLALSPWVVRNIRFDESLGRLHGYDFDFCLQVRAAGRKVVTEDLKVAHHHGLELIPDADAWVEAHMRLAEKWDGRMPGVGAGAGDWKQRARRAEAQVGLAGAQIMTTQLQASARDRQHERALKLTTDSLSWRLTAPLRRLKAPLKKSRLAGRPRRTPSKPV